MSESDLLAAILDAARLLGIRSAHFRPAQTKRGAWITPVAGDFERRRGSCLIRTR